MMTVLADELDHAMRSVADAQDRLSSTYYRLSALASGLNPLPATALTEQAIVDALKADPGMAGRVMASVAHKTRALDLREMGSAAKNFVSAGGPTSSRGFALQSLAVALAAASYRG